MTWERFLDKLNTCILNKFRHAVDVVCISTYLKYSTISFAARHTPEYLTEDEEKRPSNQKIWEIKLNKYLDREEIMQDNKNKMYAIVIVNCSPSLQSTIKGDDE